MTLEGVDYSATRPTGAQLKAAGKKFVVRYLAEDWRGITAPEKADLLANGIAICLVYEGIASRMLSGLAGGHADASYAKVKAGILGFAPDQPIYFAADFDATPAQQTVIDDYLKGCADVLGIARVGVYGGYWVVSRCEANGTAHWFWQTYAWSGGNVFRGNHLLQYNNYGQYVARIPVDLNRAFTTDYGQFPRPTAPTVKWGLPGWPSYAQTYNGAGGYAYRILERRGVAPYTAAPFRWGMKSWPLPVRFSYNTASQYARRIFINNPNYRP